uniref:Uncharacterized protein n=1 Tax=Alexandrium catenella TaxID=2925 RepID=A0A7S1QG72_ALECA
MAISRRSASICLPGTICVAVIVVGWWTKEDAAFVAARRQPALARVIRAASTGQHEVSQPQPLVPPEVNYYTNQAIMECLNEGCPIEVLDELEGKLSRDEARIKTSLEELRHAQEASFEPADVAEVLGWFDSVLANSRSIREQLQSAKQARHGLHGMRFVSQFVNGGNSGFAQQFVKGNSVSYP